MRQTSVTTNTKHQDFEKQVKSTAFCTSTNKAGVEGDVG
jgi:hypothetical protein